MNIFLIGFMGTGKSTIARRLQSQFDMKIIEMDETIVRNEGMPISEIFEKYGEEHFRDIESELLESIKESKTNNIVSCGGGVVVRPQNIECMKSNGKVVLLTATPETVYKRVRHNTDRPILNGNMNVEFIEQLMEKRRELYLKTADIIVETDNKTVEDICKEIISKVRI